MHEFLILLVGGGIAFIYAERYVQVGDSYNFMRGETCVESYKVSDVLRLEMA